MEVTAGALSETGALAHVLVKRPEEACGQAARADTEWRALGWAAAPDLGRAREEHARFRELLSAAGAVVHCLPADREAGLDSIYARDAAVAAPGGLILASMGKAERRGEPAALARGLAGVDAPGTQVVGTVTSSGRLEAGDLVWLDARTVAAGSGYRTNPEGIAQFRALTGDGVEVVIVPLPHWRGPGDVLHLMSLISPVDADLAVVYSPLLPVPFRRWLLDRGLALVEVPDEEFDSMGANVLAVAPRRCLMLDGNPRTRALLEHAGAEVMTYAGNEISRKGFGGPTCLTRPLVRQQMGSGVR
jgi:N-dimethylarginine dimethylaminohydrolase